MLMCLPKVFLDTEVFDKHGRDLSCSSFRRLIRLAEARKLELSLTSVNEQEIRTHLDRDAREAFKSLQNYRRASKLVKRVLPDPQFTPEDENPYRREVQTEFDNFICSANVQIVGVDEVSAEAVFRDYFAGTPPFAKGDKKSEFPDAFAIAAIRSWSQTHLNAVFVISGDNDWKASFKNHPTIKIKDSIEALLEEFVEAEKVTAIQEFLNSHRDQVEEMILRESEKLEFTLSDSLWNGELGGCSVEEVDCAEFHVIEADNGVAEISLFCVLRIIAEVSADDSMSAWRDPDTKDMNCVWQLGGEVEKDVEAEVTISIHYTGHIPEQCQIAHIEFESMNIFIDVDEDDLARIGEDENMEDLSNHFDTE